MGLGRRRLRCLGHCLSGPQMRSRSPASFRSGIPAKRPKPRRKKHVHLQRMRPRTRRSASLVGVLVIIIIWLSANGDELRASTDTWDRHHLLNAIRFVESNNRDDVPDGDNGLAIGPYQIHYVYWFDANEFDKQLGGTYQMCRQRAYAERVIDAYMRRHIPKEWHAGLGETIAKVHNGGPNGHMKSATKGYWQRVRKRLPVPRKRK